MPKRRLGFLMLAVSLLVALPFSCAAAQDAPRVDKETLKSWLVTTPDVIIIDVRQPKDWQASDKKIKGALRRDPNAVETWAASLPQNKKIILYCS